MPKIRKILASEKFYIIFFSLVILSLSFTPLIYHIYNSPKGTYFPLIHNHLLDFHLYISYMRQAWEGNLLLISRYTSEDFPARFAYIVYIILGRFAGITDLSLPATYTLSRFFAGSLLLYLIYIFIKKIYSAQPSSRIISFFLVVFGGGFWTVVVTNSGVKINTLLGFWTETDVLGRLTFVPHHLIAKVLMLASFLVLIRAQQRKSLRLLFISSILGLSTGLASPFVALNQEIIVGIVLFIYVFVFLALAVSDRVSRSRHPNTRSANTRSDLVSGYHINIYLLIYLFSSGLSLLYFRWLETAGYPWSVYLEWEKSGFLITVWDYLLFSGPNFIFAIFGLIYFSKQKNFQSLLLIAWFIESWLGLFILAPFFPVQNVRFLAGAYFIPLGIIAGKGLLEMAKLISQIMKKLYREFRVSLNIERVTRERDPIRRRIEVWDTQAAGPEIELRETRGYIITSILLFLTSIVFAGNIYANLASQLSFFSNKFYNVYLADDLLNAFSYLSLNTPANSVVLSQGYTANLIPAYTHNRTVHGHPTQTYNAGVKGIFANKFFTQADLDFSRQLLTQYHVSYVFYAQDTPPPSSSFTETLGLQRVYYNNLVSIYKVGK